MTKPIDPIFAPVPYGDDRQVTRTRRGLYCLEELNYNPQIVYCECKSCDYQWQIPKLDYITGLKYNGGTGNYSSFGFYAYGQYDERLETCCTGGMGLCGDVGDLVQVGTFYPYLTGGTGGTGDINDTTSTGETGEGVPVYIVCAGGSGSNSPPVQPRMFGGYPLVCPNCCRVNFEAKWIERQDNKGLTSLNFCQAIIVIDFQRIKSDFALGHV